ncbi:MAG: hypothetical protein RL292_88, partial [Candidatus Parcubacteria bacterium]
RILVRAQNTTFILLKNLSKGLANQSLVRLLTGAVHLLHLCTDDQGLAK